MASSTCDTCNWQMWSESTMGELSYFCANPDCPEYNEHYAAMTREERREALESVRGETKRG